MELFSKEHTTISMKEEYVCPIWSSSNWKFPNPLMGSESMINLPHLINNLFQCGRCDYIGIFFISKKGATKEIDVTKDEDTEKIH